MPEGVPKILVVDDEAPIRKFLRISLSAQGFSVYEAGVGHETLQVIQSVQPDLVILDLGLPDEDGQDVLQAVRAISNVAVIVLSVRAEEGEKVLALDHGATDYVTKPFGIAELTARIRAALRARPGAEQLPDPLVIGLLQINVARHEVRLAGNLVKLSPREFDLLALLAANAGRVLTHQYILSRIWGPFHEEDTQYLRVYIGQLRQKLGDNPLNPKYIANEPGIGYRLLDQ